MALDLDIWTAEFLSEELGGRPDLAVATLRQAIDIYTREKLQKILDGTGCDRWANVPFTTKEQLRANGQLGNGDNSALQLSEADLQHELDFYTGGLKLVVDETDNVLILLPSEDGRAGTFFADAATRIGAKTIAYGEAFTQTQSGGREEAEQILQLIRDEGVTCVIASPTHMVALARAAARQAEAGADEIYLRSVLLSGGLAPNKTVMMLEETFQAMIFEFSDVADVGLGFAVSCGYGKGSHIRETDIFIELINPVTGEVVRTESPKTPGFSNYGEIVFTTLNRDSAPLVRYRTGYYSRWIFGECPCGSWLKRLDKIYPPEE
ncbi:MAG: phenylacetate--CoA ligase [Clostridiales bacterium]|nr:phenylacetate--CoA ligase [Clostridiales bacterium]